MDMNAEMKSKMEGTVNEIIDSFVNNDDLKTDEAQFIWTRNVFSQLCPKMFSSTPSPKFASNSEKYRSDGNKNFKDKHYKKALDLYTKSIINAPALDQEDNSDRHLAKSLCNRSAALFYLKEYEASLVDIEGALEAGYMEERQYLLYSRQFKCLHALQRSAEAKLAFDKVVEFLPKSDKEPEEQTRIQKELENYSDLNIALSNSPATTPESAKVGLPCLPHGSNSSHPSLSSSCKVMYNTDKGRYVVATRDIEPGEVILVEEPYSSLLKRDRFEDYCDHCFSRLPIAPIACQWCINVLFCSPACRENAWSHHHMYECSMNAEVYLSGENDQLTFRTAVVAGLGELLKYKDDSTPATTTLRFDMKGCNEQGQYRSNDFNSINHLVDHSNKFLKQNMCGTSYAAVLYIMWLDEKTNFFQTIPPEEKEAAVVCVGTCFMHIFRVINLNSAAIIESVCGSVSNAYPRLEIIGKGLYPTYALFNHSCAANTTLVSYNNNIGVHANSKIKKSEELTTLYVANYLFCRKEVRQLKLQQAYYFRCCCEACVNDWPLLIDMAPQEALFKCQNCQHPLGSSTGYYPHATRVCPCCRQRQVIPAIEVLFEECKIKAQEATELRFVRKFVEARNMLNLEIKRVENLLVSPRQQMFFMVLKRDFEVCCTLMGNIHIKED